MINLKSLLLERHLEDLFHATQSDKLLRILKNDALKLAFVGGTEADQQLNKGYAFFLSTMRAKYGNFARGTLGDKYISYPVVVHLNGQNLTAAGYKVFPVDFWQMGAEKSEQEERIASNKDEIRPLSKFVKAVHVYVDLEHKSPHYVERLHEISALAKTSSVPIYFYLDRKYYRAQQTDKAIRTLDDALPQPEWTPDDLETKKWKADFDAKFDNTADKRYKKDTERLRIFLDLYYGKEVDTDSYPGDHVRRWLLYYPHDAYTQIATDIHNLKGSHPPIFREFVAIMKKEGFKTVKDFITFMISREQEKEKSIRDKEADKKGWKR